MKSRSKPASSLEIICYYTGYVILCTAFLLIVPVTTAVVFTEWAALVDFIISISFTLIIGITMMLIGWRAKMQKASIQWKHGYLIASVSWLVLMLLCAIPYFLSGHTGSVLDACFDVMSGFTTTGLVLTQDLDHLSVSLNMWRHMLTFIGGQGMVVLALTIMVKDTNGAYRLYVGEAKDIELVPNVKGTTRLIWKISMIYLIIGTCVLWIDGIIIGLQPVSAFLHALYIFESAWSTGGFAPMTQNIMYYHSLSFETISMIIFVLGSLNFGLHYSVWQGNRKELRRNIETQSFFITTIAACMLAVYGLSKSHVYPDLTSLFRRVIFNILSAHTTTGFGSIYARQFALEWGDFGVLIMILVMLIGGSACSTAGGFKGLRMGIIFKGLVMDTKKLLCSERSRKAYKFHHIKDYVLDDSMVKSSLLIVFCYMVLFCFGTLLGTMYGYTLPSAAFESASVTGNVGFSIGITAPEMPAAMKVYYIIAMYMGRLEFLSVFALIGYIVGGIKKQCAKYLKHAV